MIDNLKKQFFISGINKYTEFINEYYKHFTLDGLFVVSNVISIFNWNRKVPKSISLQTHQKDVRYLISQTQEVLKRVAES